MFPPSEPTPSFPYRIVAKLGEGAMGAVYRAEDLDLAREVAIKVIKPEYFAAQRGADAQSAVKRFLQEARAAAALSHPGVTTVHRIGTEGGWPYIAMEWLDGRTLEALLVERVRFSAEQAARLGIQVLAVLQAAHAAGIIHRDIKPGNLMVMGNGRVKVMDFGVARVRGSQLAHTQAGMVIGTPHYAAPEQLAGQAIDCRADLYAVGSVLYEMVVGRPPFDATTIFELIHAVHATPPPPPSTLVAGLPRELDAVLLQALAKRPEARFATAQEMSAALQPFRTTTPARASGPLVVPRGATLERAPMVVADGDSPQARGRGAVRRWRPTGLARQRTRELLDRLLDRPLHAPAFCGALEVPGACLLICDGIIYAAFDPATGGTGDDVIEALPDELDATLYALPAGLDPRLIALLASTLLPAPRPPELDASLTDLPQLAGKLAAEGFDGAMRFAAGARLGFALFSRGRHVLDVFGRGWTTDAAAQPWDEWISASGAFAAVEPLRTAYPSVTFRQQLRDLALEVVRPGPGDGRSIRSDTLAEAQALQLRPRESSRLELRRGDSTLSAMVEADPAHGLARWLLVELPAQFAQFGRTSRWKALIEPLGRIREIRLHHALPRASGDPATFDVVSLDERDRVQHVVDRVAAGTRQAVESCLARAIATKDACPDPGALGGAILVAPSFDEAALDAYLQALRGGGRRSFFSGIDALSHREGFLRLSGRRGLHVLLVEEGEGRRRPLMPQ